MHKVYVHVLSYYLSSLSCSTPLPGFAVLIEKIASAPERQKSLWLSSMKLKLCRMRAELSKNHLILACQSCLDFLRLRHPFVLVVFVDSLRSYHSQFQEFDIDRVVFGKYGSGCRTSSLQERADVMLQ